MRASAAGAISGGVASYALAGEVALDVFLIVAKSPILEGRPARTNAGVSVVQCAASSARARRPPARRGKLEVRSREGRGATSPRLHRTRSYVKFWSGGIAAPHATGVAPEEPVAVGASWSSSFRSAYPRLSTISAPPKVMSRH